MRRGSWFAALLVLYGTTGLALVAWAVPQVTLVQASWFIAAAFLIELIPTRVRDDVQSSLTSVVSFTAVLVGGPALAIVTVAGVVAALKFRPTAHGFLPVAAVNVGQLTVAALAAGAVFTVLAGAAQVGSAVTTPRAVVAVVLLAVVHTLVSNTAISVVIWSTSGDPLRSTVASLGAAIRVRLLVDVALSILATAVLVEVGVAALLLLFIPALVARHGMLGFQEEAVAYDRLVRALVKVIEVKDGYTRGHAERVAELAEAIAGQVGYGYARRRVIRYAALLHDVGKLGVDPGVLNKPAALDDDEFAHIRSHPLIGVEILADIDFLSSALDAVRYHHERFDGRGYPHGLAGHDIPEVARIVTVADAFDAMTSSRSYRPAMPVEQAIAELRRCSGTQFDPEVVAALVTVAAELDWQPTFEHHADHHDHGHAAPHDDHGVPPGLRRLSRPLRRVASTPAGERGA